MRPSDLADPTYFTDGDQTEFELVWSKDETVATLHILVGGTKHRIRTITIGQLDLLRDFLNSNLK